MRLGGAADERLDGCPNELLALSHIDVWETAADLMKERIDIEWTLHLLVIGYRNQLTFY